MMGASPFPGGHPVWGADDSVSAVDVTSAAGRAGEGVASAIGGRGGEAAAQGIKVGTAVGGGTASVLAATAAAGLAIPGPGWVYAAGAGTAAGVIALVASLKKGGMTKAQAVQQAQAMGLSGAAEVPSFTKRALKWDSGKRTKKARQLAKKLSRGKKWYAPGSWFRSDARLRTKLAILGALDRLDRLEKGGGRPTYSETATSGLPALALPTVGSPVFLIAAGLVTLTLIAAALKR